jgi:hypothetical protein
VRIGKVAVDGGSARLADYEPAEANRGRPVIHQFRNIGFTSGTVTWPLSPGGADEAARRKRRKGVMNIDGQVTPTGPAAQLQLDLRELDIAPLQPYMADRFNAALRSGALTLKGKVAYERRPASR